MEPYSLHDKGQNTAGHSTKSSDPDQSFQLPVPALPKGGGTISGLGEKFSVNPVSGAGIATVPIACSAGRGGFGPALSLSYSSNEGNGIFGLGWRLNISSISRKTSKGIPQYRDAEESDTFLLSDAEDLVPALVYKDGAWEPDEYEQEGYRIKRYRPRIEGPHSHIERWTRMSDGDMFWKITDAENRVSYFGRSQSARVYDPAAPSRVFEWMLEEEYDGQGQYIQYSYKRENTDGVQRVSYEANRESSTVLYPKMISYANKQHNDLSAWHFKVVFDYGEHSGEIPSYGETRTWSLRKDPFSAYRSGFEQRRYRLCQRVLMFHEFDELGTDPYLVRSTEFTYNEQASFSLLMSSRQLAYERLADGTWSVAESLPLDFSYTEAVPSREVESISAAYLDNLPAGVDGLRYQWTDLEGEGLNGILCSQGDQLFYQANEGDGAFSEMKLLASQARPTAAVGSDVPVLNDLDGDGRQELLLLGKTGAACYKRNDEKWELLRTFSSFPNTDISDASVRFIDLDGDGLADLLMSDGEQFYWHKSIGTEGFDAAGQLPQFDDEELGPRLLFDDKEQSIFLADMSGDGLLDLLRIRNGELCYWPNKGYGVFGKKILLENSPFFDHPELFSTERIRLGDIDGTGCTDILYIGRNTVSYWMNCSGNSLSEKREIECSPDYDRLSQVQLIDLLGKGTACLVWSSPLAQQTQLRYIDLMGKKPWLMQSLKNNMGGETRVEYAPSTRFYIADKKAGTPWISSLPFMVHVVQKQSTYDHITGIKFVNTYAYHHGYYDGEEREFRGFGLLEQWDTEQYPEFNSEGIFPAPVNSSEESHVPPVYSKTWYHTGCMIDTVAVSRQYESEYFSADANAFRVPDSVLPAGLSTAELREAYRALKGTTLRSEVYALDGSTDSDKPYAVTESNAQVVLVQPAAENQYAVFQVLSSESITHHYDRRIDDPRVGHSMVLESNGYGVPVKSVSVVYPRRAAEFTEQEKLYIGYGESELMHHDDMDYLRLNVLRKVKSYELGGLSLPSEGPLLISDVQGALSSAVEISYEKNFSGAVEKRLLSYKKITYYNESLDGEMPAGSFASHGIPFRSYGAVFNQAMVAAAFNDDGSIRVTDALLSGEGKFIFEEDLWWSYSGIVEFDPTHFYRPVAVKNIFDERNYVEYDAYSLMVLKTVNALGYESSAKADYRVLGISEITDINLNRTAVRWDTRGVVVASAIMGKHGETDPEKQGDTLDDPTQRFEYDIFNWKNNGKPNYTHVYMREKHGSDNPRWQESYSYFGGTGQLLMAKVQAEAGNAYAREADGSLKRDASGALQEEFCESRWVGNGRMILNNKGLPVKQYEPYFSSTYHYESEAELVETGTSPVLRYDPIGRNIRTDFPNGTFSKIEINPWKLIKYDVNDTVLESTWYADLGSPDPSLPEPADARVRAAWLAARHSNTPAVAHLDSLGRVFYTISDNADKGQYTGRVEMDIEGNHLKIYDTRNREQIRGYFAMGALPLQSSSTETGVKRILSNGAGMIIRGWDEGSTVRPVYGPMQRPLGLFTSEGAAAEKMLACVVYSDVLSDPAAKNLKGLPYLKFDQSGVLRLDEMDFKGQLISSSVQLAKAYATETDWSSLYGLTDLAAIETAAASLLEPELLSSSNAWDALGRPLQSVMPNGSILRPSFNEANILEQVEVKLATESSYRSFLQAAEYNAKGQRIQVNYGNGTSVHFSYEETTQRLQRMQMLESSSGDVYQDLNYFYDPTGNITQCRDDAQQTLFFRNAVVSPESKFEYDAIYQLCKASGRELAGLVADSQRSYTDLQVISPLPHVNDATAVRNYTEEYEYDDCGNITQMKHRASGGNWTRNYNYDSATNRLLGSSAAGDADGVLSETYTYDALGRMLSMPHLSTLRWNALGHLRELDLGGGGKAYYVYDSSGKRTRKVIEKNGKICERIYLGAYEIYRERSSTVNIERHTLHVHDSGGRIASIETTTTDTTEPSLVGNSTIRYQYANHLGSASLELDENGNLISYEEYHPFGTTAYRAGRSETEVSLKRYRFTGMERDEESGLSYHGARYYATWLGRWTSADPVGLTAGLNLYRYCSNSPLMAKDPGGTDETYIAGTDNDSLTQNSTYSDRVSFADRHGYDYYEDDAHPAAWVGSDSINGNWQGGVLTQRPGGGSEAGGASTEGNDNSTGGGSTTPPGPQASNGDQGAQQGAGNSEQSQDGESAEGGEQSSGAVDTPGTGGESMGLGPLGAEVARYNPEGYTLQVPDSYDAQKMSAYQEGIRRREIGRNAGSGANSTKARRNSAPQRAARNAFRASPQPAAPAPSGSYDADHLIELQHDLTGRKGTSAADYRWQDSALNQREGSQSWALNRNNPQGVPAGGVARARDAGRFYNQPGFRTAMRGLGYVLTAAGPVLSFIGASQIENDAVRTAGQGAAGVEGVGAAAYLGGKLLLSGETAAVAVSVGTKVMGVAGGIGMTVMSGYQAIQEFSNGDYLGGTVDTLAAVGGLLITGAAIGLLAPEAAIVGAVVGIGAGLFHLGRWALS